MKLHRTIFGIFLLWSLNGLTQGFLNLDFESAKIVADNSQGNPFVFATNAIPHWVAYIGGSPLTDIAYNSIALDEPAVSIHGTNSAYVTPIQGNFSVYLQAGSQFAHGTNSAIGQTGQIPLSALSLLFWGSVANVQITFAGQTLVYAVISSTANYNIYGADISAFAGQTGQLLFTASRPGGAILDNIQFSTSSVPEPGVLSLLGLAGLGFLLAKKRQRR